MKTILSTLLFSYSLANAAVLVPREDKGTCGCPLYGPFGTCKIFKNPFLASNQDMSAFCSSETTPRFQYVCPGTYDSPNCNACSQSIWGNYGPPGQDNQCPGDQWCSSNGIDFHVCGDGETPFAPKYYVSAAFAGGKGDVNTAVIASGTDSGLDNFINEKLPAWFSECSEQSCNHGDIAPEYELGYKGTRASGLSFGKLKMRINEASFDWLNGDANRDVMLKLAGVTILRATTCTTEKYWPTCITGPDHETDCSDKEQQTIITCRAPSSIDVQMRLKADGAMKAQLNFDLVWTEESTKFDCSKLEGPGEWLASLGESIGGEGDDGKNSKLDGVKNNLSSLLGTAPYISTFCEGIQALVELAHGQ